MKKSINQTQFTVPKVRPYTHLLPTLFDRLRDDAPQRENETVGECAVSRLQLREIIQRDLAYLLNTGNSDDMICSIRYPEVAKSTLNFGMSPLAGGYLSEGKWAVVESKIRQAIFQFEPRLLPGSVVVSPLNKHVLKANTGSDYNVLMFVISGKIHMDPYPMTLVVHSSVDLETNRISFVSK